MNVAPDVNLLCRSRWRLPVNDGDFQHAIRFPIAGWPAYAILHEADGPGLYLEREIFDESNFQGSPYSFRRSPQSPLSGNSE